MPYANFAPPNPHPLPPCWQLISDRRRPLPQHIETPMSAMSFRKDMLSPPPAKDYSRVSLSSLVNKLLREKPMLHSKLYCDSIRNRVQSTITKLTDENGRMKLVSSHTELAETANGVRLMARLLSRAKIQLDARAIMIVTKARDNLLTFVTREIVQWLLTRDRNIVVYVDAHLKKSKRFDAKDIRAMYPKAEHCLKYWDRKLASTNPELFDLVITLGGDGTVLYVSSLFQRIVPPVMLFSMGSLGFLTNFDFGDYKEKVSDVIEKGVIACLRMRFTCRLHDANGKLVKEQQVLNELVVDRGPLPFVTNLELYGDGSLLTVAQADGLIIATPTGLTAYSLSAGGSLVHPGVSAISVTPICPHTLSFRPILLPDGMFLKVKVPETLRLVAWASFDGRLRTKLDKGCYVTVYASPYPFPTISALKTEYIDSVSRNLNWNERKPQKLFTDYLSDDSKQKMDGHPASTDPDSQLFDIDFSDDDELRLELGLGLGLVLLLPLADDINGLVMGMGALNGTDRTTTVTLTTSVTLCD